MPLHKLIADPIAAYLSGAHERFTTLGMLFTWLLRYREDTATSADAGPFRDWLQGDGKAASLRPAPLTDVAKLQREFLAFEFPR